MDETINASINTNILMQYPEFVAASKEIEAAYDELVGLINKHPALMKLVNAYADQGSVTENIVYRQGFADGLRFLTLGLAWTPNGQNLKV